EPGDGHRHGPAALARPARRGEREPPQRPACRRARGQRRDRVDGRHRDGGRRCDQRPLG
ncbi:MAG: Nodulin-related protein CC_0717, partial [uncultured Nocardioides sp.]